VAPIMVPLDMSFKDLAECSALAAEEPLASYTGDLPRTVKVAATIVPGEEEPEVEEKVVKPSSRHAAQEAKPVVAPFRYVVNTVRLNNNLLTSIATLPASMSKVVADLSQIAILDLSFNAIERIDPSLTQLYNLSGLRLHANKLATFDEIAPLLRLKHLNRLTLMNNALDQHRDYRLLAMALFPSLKAFDNVLITNSEKDKIESFIHSPRGRHSIGLIHRALARMEAPPIESTPPSRR